MSDTPTDTPTDAELVAGHLAGDRGALAAIYDRYADSLYDTAAAMTRQRHDAADVVQDVFVIAAERMDQLRDPQKLKSWLFAILRNEVYRRTGKRRRTVATDFTDPVVEMNAPSEPADDGTGLEYEELAALVRGAAAGLDERDQLVLELSVRQGLQGDDLAAALGVSPQQSYGLVHRMRQRTERSLGAYCVARAGRKDCPELAEILRGWDGEFSVLVRKRVARHVDGCETCERSRRTLAPFALFGAAPAFAAPSDLRDRVLAAAGGARPAPPYGFEAPGGFPTLVRHGRRIVAWSLAAAAIVLVGLGSAVFVLADDDRSIAIDDGTTTTVPDDATTSTPEATASSTAGSATGPTTAEASDDGTGTTNTSTTTNTTTNTNTTVPPTITTTTLVAASPASTVVGTTIPAATNTTTITTPTTTPTTSPAGAPTTTAAPTVTSTTTPATTATTTTTTTATTTTTTAPAPGVLGLSATTIDFGRTRDQAVVTLSNTGGRPVDWSTSTGPLAFRAVASPFSFAPTSGSLAAGASIEIVVTIDRDWPTEGPVPSQRVTFAAAGTTASVDLLGEIGRAPVLRPVQVPPARACVSGVANGLFWQVAIADETPPITARVEVVTPGGRVLADEMVRNGDWYGALVPDGDGDGLPDAGTHTWTVRAVDALGNLGTLQGTVDLGAC